MSQKASTRIPTFGSRIPLPGACNPKDSLKQLLPLTPSRSDVGRRVRIGGEKEGVLRFAGEVHFAAGTWCGVEVQKGAGKNDGQVRGIRYFSCAATCGLMVPSSKISFVDDVIEDPSGPYSILFGIENELSKLDLTYMKSNLLGNNTFTKSNEDLRGEEEDLNKTICKENFILENLVGYNYNTHVLTEIEGSPRKTRISPSQVEDDSNKRDSLDFDESLGILTPDQMMDVSALVGSRTPSSENIRLLPHDEQSQADFSLGLISAQTMKTDEINLCLDLKDVTLTRIEQTPSPEELPLDPTPALKAEASKGSKPSNSFITSITSITSLDTGYQGDGEMSRPGSRGADNSPLTRRPQPRAPPRRADPMTDSDFYTESDADNHEEHPLRGDRHAQVIDGTLYGVDPQAAADIYVNNRENMDSSGIFTDIERENSDTKNQTFELSPTDSSTKTISDDSQNPNKTFVSDQVAKSEDRASTPASVSTVASSPGYTKSPRIPPKSKEECNSANKKHKMPKRNVASKVKAMIEPNNKENEKKAEQKKPPGRWDAVMTKISSPQDAKKLKEVKSKVFSGIPSSVNRNKENVKKTTSAPKMTRRVRTRTTLQNTAGSKNMESIGSSLSDLSGASSAKNNGSVKKQRDVVRVAQVLTTAKLSPKSTAHSTVTEAKNKANTNLNNELKPAAGRILFNTKDNRKKESSPKDIGKSAVKGGRVLPGTRPLQPLPVAAQPEKQSQRTVEALAVLVHHLVFNLEAFRNPSLKKEVERMRLDAEEAHLSCLQLEEALSEEKRRHMDVIQDERNKYRAEITQLIEKHRNEIIKLNLQQQEAEKLFELERETTANSMTKVHEEHLRNIKLEFEKFKKMHEESLDILREENDTIMEQIDEKNACINHLRTKESSLQAQLQSALQEISQLRAGREAEGQLVDLDNTAAEAQSLRAVLDLKLQEIAELRKALAEASQKAEHLPAAEEKIAVLSAKCEDLEAQLERKNECELQLLNENKKLNETIKEEINQKKRMHQHNEELQWRLQQNKEVVTKVLEEAEANSAFNRSMLSASFNERHNSFNKSGFERTLSFRERSLSNKSNNSQCSRKSKNSFELDFDDLSPPDSPKVKGVVEKSDSVSYVLEMDERPEVVASRIVRRSFRHATPPKNTPTKSPANKRPRMKNNLTLSASATSIGVKSDDSKSARSCDDSEDIFFWETVSASTPNNSNNVTKVHYWSTPNDFDDEDDIKIPTLPSEIGRKHANTLPVPKHLAGEAMVSESNSEDESSTSSSSGQL